MMAAKSIAYSDGGLGMINMIVFPIQLSPLQGESWGGYGVSDLRQDIHFVVVGPVPAQVFLLIASLDVPLANKIADGPFHKVAVATGFLLDTLT